MLITDIISLDRTVCAVECQSKKKIFELISELAVQQRPELEQAKVLESLVYRERMGSTGIGLGIAIPHGKIDNLNNVMAIVITTDQPIEFDAIDGNPVDVFFALLVPEKQHDQHIKTLSSVARKLSDKQTVKAIRSANSKHEIIQALS